MKIILASQSPRRREILELMALPFEVIESHVKGVILSSHNRARRGPLTLQGVTIGVSQCQQGQTFAHGTLGAVVHIGGITHVAADRHPGVGQLGSKAALAVAEGRP